MSKNRDYTRYSKETVAPTEPAKVMETERPIESVETIAEDIQVVETDQVSKIEEPKRVIGIVANCSKLNVRECPQLTATILSTITEGTELIINEEESTKDFYKICTPIGLEGYCMKQFVTIMP